MINVAIISKILLSAIGESMAEGVNATTPLKRMLAEFFILQCSTQIYYVR